jgi:TerB-C domain
MEQNEQSSPAAQPIPTGAPAVSGLDERHGGLARGLESREAFSREDFEQLAQRFGLMPDGALDVLNEAAIEKCGEPLLEGDDPIEVNKRVLEEMTR